MAKPGQDEKQTKEMNEPKASLSDAAMTAEEQRNTIAEVCGWLIIDQDPIYGPLWWSHKDRGAPCMNPPDYPNDLNACHEMENVLTEDQGGEYEEVLEAICQKQLVEDGTNHWLRFRICHATAAHRCEAFLRTLNLWED